MQLIEKELCEELKGYQSFEDLILNISARFINLPVTAIDHSIEDAQRHICVSLGIDLSALWQWIDGYSDSMTVTHLYSPKNGPAKPVGIDSSAAFPFIYKKLLQGETLAFSNEDLPEEAEIDLQSRESFNVISSVNIPLIAGDRPILGVLTFDSLHQKRVWTETEVQRLKLVAEIFTNVLMRKQYEQDLLESNSRLSLAVEAAEAGFWDMDYRTGTVRVSRQNRKIFGFSPHEAITKEHYRNVILNTDWPMVDQIIENSFRENRKFHIEYRLNDDSGKTRWVSSWGSPTTTESGQPCRLIGISIDISKRKQLEDKLKAQCNELQTLKDQVEQENVYLRDELLTEKGFEDIIGQSELFKKVLGNASTVASTPATVLILGETGTGKGLIANLIHQLSERSTRPIITVNCAALPHNLIESELFGRSKGAFTGADTKQAGRFEVANHGTIFLDEIGEMELEMQTKLLRVLQDGEFERLGSSTTIKVDVRVIAATGRDLKQDVKDGRFREDLYYRLNVFPITIPPLRDRTEDIPYLAYYFVKKYSRKMRKNIETIPKRALEQMTRYQWPGNVRELEHLIERCIILSEGPSLSFPEDCLDNTPRPSGGSMSKDLVTNERNHIIDVLTLTNWKIEGQDGAAALLDVHPSTLRFKLKKLGLKRQI